MTTPAEQLSDLLVNVVEIKSSDYNNVKALVDGVVNRFMGFEFVSPDKARYNIQNNNASGVGASVTDPLQRKMIYNKAFNLVKYRTMCCI